MAGSPTRAYNARQMFRPDAHYRNSVATIAGKPDLRARLNQHIIAEAWPRSLKQLSFGMRFNHPTAGVSWPDAPQEIAFLGQSETARAL